MKEHGAWGITWLLGCGRYSRASLQAGPGFARLVCLIIPLPNPACFPLLSQVLIPDKRLAFEHSLHICLQKPQPVTDTACFKLINTPLASQSLENRDAEASLWMSEGLHLSQVRQSRPHGAGWVGVRAAGWFVGRLVALALMTAEMFC